jgi:uncharacterized protein
VRVLLILILLLIVAWWVNRALERRARRPKQAARKRVAERMLACEHCGVHIPESEGVRSETGFFCCDEHRRLGNRRQ